MNRDNMRRLVMERVDKQLPKEKLEGYISEFLQSQRICVLCTCKRAAPRATPIEYYSEGTTLYMIADPGTKITNIESNPRVSVGIFAPYSGWLSVKGAQITGKAKIIRFGDPDRAQAVSVYKWQNSLGELGITEPPKQMMIGVEAEKIELLDFSLKVNGYSPKQIWTR